MRECELYEDNLPKNIKFYNNVYGAHHDQIDGTLWAYNPLKYPEGFDLSPTGVYGYLDWSSFAGNTQIQMIKVALEFRRSGIATAMIKKLEDENKEPIVWSGTIGHGDALRKSMIGNA